MPMVRCGNTPPEVGTAICLGSINGNNSGKTFRITQGGTFRIYAMIRRYGAYDPYVGVVVNGVTKWSWHNPNSSADGQGNGSVVTATTGTIELQEGDLVAVTSSGVSAIGMSNCSIICYKDIV